MARSLNKVELIGNLTRDPELRYTPAGTAVCTFGLATNRQWTTGEGEKKEEAEFHRIVSWNKLAELCAQLLTKGRKVYVEGRLQTRRWTGQDGNERTTTEIVINDMIILDTRGAPLATAGTGPEEINISPEEMEQAQEPQKPKKEEVTTATKSGDTKTKKNKTKAAKEEPAAAEAKSEEPEDIPF